MLSKKVTENCQVGLDFFEYLKETSRTSIKDREKLKEIYNQEFRNRKAGIKDPNFGSVLYALGACRMISKGGRGRNNISFKPKVQALYVDQWSSRRNPRPAECGQEAAVSVPSVQAFSSADQAETGVRARRKLATDLMRKLKIQRTEFISDKHGIKITSDDQFTDGKMCLCVESLSEYTVYLNIENSGSKTVHFTYYTALHWLQYFSLEDEHKVTKTNPLALNPGESYEIKVKFNSCSVGFYPATVAFEFKADLQSSTSFHIVRFIEAQCMTTLGKELAPTAPYRPRSLPAWTPQTDFTIVDGQRPEGLSVMQLKNEVQLKPYRIPDFMNHLIRMLKEPTSFTDKRKDMLETPLCWENYAEKFNLLLYLEELQMEVDIRRYNIPNDDQKEATMEKDPYNKKLLILKVPGVAENRPSVLRGDKLLVWPVGENQKKYCGYVHSVQLDSVKLGFSSELLDIFVKGMKFNVEFTVNLLTLRIQHRAAEFAVRDGLEPVLFPTAPPSPAPLKPLPELKLFDRKLEKNPEQYQAVQHILRGSCKPAPYLVFGPPGTGKTVTVVEAIKQTEKAQAHCHILACAPSNSAADLLCRKILDHVNQSKVYRMYGSSHNPGDVPEDLKACSNLVGDCYVYPAKEELMKYKIMVTTLLTAGRLVSGNIPTGHFTHVFVDEAGHAVETECIVPLAGLLNPESGQVVLAGDPKQLGPILRSPFVLKYGMGVSLLERLMTSFPLYQKDNGVFDKRFVTKLLHNYRSHPAILEIPNELFYEGELLPFADEVLRNSYCSWEHLPTKGFPIIFHGVTGLDERESSSPSFFNRAEVEVLMDYVKKLLQTHGKKGLSSISPRDIGIIAPYRKQVQKIRKALEKVEKDFKLKDMSGLKVGSVEEFQGQERRVILVSTVRSSAEYAEMDKKFKLGFVKNEKRFNVAVTRAKALLIVVGNPLALRTDSTWARFLQFCKEQGGHRDYDSDEDDIAVHLGPVPETGVTSPDFPLLPVQGYTFQSDYMFVPTFEQHNHLESIKVSHDRSATIEAKTRDQSNNLMWSEERRPRLTASQFWEAGHVRSESTAKSLADRILKGTPQTAAMKTGLMLEADILKRYSNERNVSVLPCGFIVHPDAPHLGASPDGKVVDPKETPLFGLVEVKYCNTDSVSQVTHLIFIQGQATLKKNHKYYWQVQGQLAVSGLKWCDFVTQTKTDLTVERIWRDDQTISEMRQKLDYFYFNTYMDVFLESKQ